MKIFHRQENAQDEIIRQPPPLLVSGGSSTFVCVGLALSFFPCTDTFPAAAVATAAGFDVFAGSTLGASALSVVVAVAL